jgi:hypothetical protein
MTELTIQVPVDFTLWELDLLATASPRFTLSVNGPKGFFRRQRTEYARAPLWIPYLPSWVGQIVRATEPTIYEVTGTWEPVTATAYAEDVPIAEMPLIGKRHLLVRGDRLTVHPIELVGVSQT